MESGKSRYWTLVSQSKHSWFTVLDLLVILSYTIIADYHCGNGTISIFHNDSTVLVASLHCDPNFDYPFHSGFADESSCATTLNFPLAPGTTWEGGYRQALQTALDTISAFKAEAVAISMGLDTHEGDPCAIRRAGFRLKGKDYWEMGLSIAKALSEQLPVVFIQEGGYRMDAVGEAASNVLLAFLHGRTELKSNVKDATKD